LINLLINMSRLIKIEMKLRYVVFSLIEKSREVLSVRNQIPSDRFGKASRTLRKIPFVEEPLCEEESRVYS
jgi:hypothetical protein